MTMTITADPFTFQSHILAHAASIAAALPVAARLTDPTVLGAAILAARLDELLQGDGTLLGATSATAKPVPITKPHPIVQAQADLVARFGAASLEDDAWCWQLTAYQPVASLLSVPQRVDVLLLLVTEAVVLDDDTHATVQGSRAYAVTMPPSGDLADGGFQCSCKGFWAHGGGTLCKHVAAATIAQAAHACLV